MKHRAIPDGAKTPSPVDRHVGQRLKLRRQMLGMSQEALGEKLGITFQQIQKYEKGMNRIVAGRLQAAAVVLGVPLEYFFEGAPADQGLAAGTGRWISAPEPTVILNERGALALLKAYGELNDPRLRRAVVGLVQAMAAGLDPRTKDHASS